MARRTLVTTLRAALLLPALLAPASATWAAETVDRRTGCRFEMPADWQGHAGQWIGACPGMRADGRGVLRILQGGQLAALFLGEMSQGRPALGVIEVAGGYMAGRFAEGRLLDTDDRNQIIEAFRTASVAAREASEQFRRNGNEASARHYAALAERLAGQMD
ncbi:hypothetical protein [Falsiroseomonas sp.]|uniref:hypothetical protein n=1 Tax=Falsiroseomonas sp. TaxID=2870721 RepID=UPI0035635A47